MVRSVRLSVTFGRSTLEQKVVERNFKLNLSEIFLPLARVTDVPILGEKGQRSGSHGPKFRIVHSGATVSDNMCGGYVDGGFSQCDRGISQWLK